MRFNIKVPERMEQVISLFFLIGLWQDNNRTDWRKWVSRMLHLLVYIYYPVSLAAGALLNNNESEKMYLIVCFIMTSILSFRLYYILWKGNQIYVFIQEMCEFSFTNIDEFHQAKKKISIFIKCVTYSVITLLSAIIAAAAISLPIFTEEKRLPINIYFPLDWKHNYFFFWIAFGLVIYEVLLSVVITLLSTIVWYLMMSCEIKYQALGNEFKNLGVVSYEESKRISVGDKRHLFHMELIQLIKKHQILQETTDHFKSFFSTLFFFQIATSGLSISGSVYALAFTSIENPFEVGVYVVVMLYNFFDIFVLTHFGNQIKCLSGRLSYCLFECNWIDQPESCKKCIVILMEALKRPQELVVGKLYPLDYEIFTQILRLAYSMFNILRNFK